MGHWSDVLILVSLFFSSEGTWLILLNHTEKCSTYTMYYEALLSQMNAGKYSKLQAPVIFIAMSNQMLLKLCNNLT